MNSVILKPKNMSRFSLYCPFTNEKMGMFCFNKSKEAIRKE